MVSNELDGKKCCADVWCATRYRNFPCENRAKVIRDGKPYCGVHDPEKKKAREAKRDAKWAAEARFENARYAERRAKERIADAVIAGRDAALPVLLGEYHKAEAEHDAARKALAEIVGGA